MVEEYPRYPRFAPQDADPDYDRMMEEALANLRAYENYQADNLRGR